MDEVHRFSGGDQVVSCNGGDSFTVVAYLAPGQDVLVHQVESHPVVEFFAGDHGPHAGQGLRFGGVDLFDPGPGVGAFEHLTVQHARQGHVADIGGLAGDLFDGVDAGVVLAHIFQIFIRDILKHVSIPPSSPVARSRPAPLR